jgi:hypothetical protein
MQVTRPTSSTMPVNMMASIRKHHKPTTEAPFGKAQGRLRHGGDSSLNSFSPGLSGSVVDSLFVGIAQISFHREVFVEAVQVNMLNAQRLIQLKGICGERDRSLGRHDLRRVVQEHLVDCS